MDFKFIVSKIPPDEKQIKAYVKDNKAGAIVIFNGIVRETNKGKKVKSLLYKVSKKECKKILKKYLEKYNNSLKKIFVFHAEGNLSVGDNTIIIATSSHSRKESFNATFEILNFMHSDLPVTKKEFYIDGSFNKL